LRSIDPLDTTWRDALWATHEAINNGAKVFGDWLLTLRGALSHDLAEPPPPTKNSRTPEEAATLRKNRRILLALSWLSVEDERGSPIGEVRVAMGTDAESVRQEKVLAAFRNILLSRGITGVEVDSWIDDCSASLSSRIRDDAVWVNRSAAFNAAVKQIGPSLTSDEVWDILEPFFGSREAYFAGVSLADDDDAGSEEKAKDLVQKAGQWLSSRFGTGTGANFASMAKVYAAMTAWARQASSINNGPEAIADLARHLAPFSPESSDADGLLSLIRGPGYKSATRNVIKSWESRPAVAPNLNKFAETTAADEAKCKANVGGKGRRPWSDAIIKCVEAVCGFTYLQDNGPARHSEFAVMLDHAARRVSIGHSWIKRAEAERRRFEEDARRLADVPSDAAAWLERFIADRSGTSGAAAAGGEYRIRRRAIEGWDEVVKRWKRASCKSVQDRIGAAREAQADPDIDKFGDIQLFEALAAEDAEYVWRQDGIATTEPLRDYVAGQDARFKQRRFKVPAYRHPDPLRHPVFGDFGNSRWEIEYAVHAAAKAAGANRKLHADRAAWLKDHRGLCMGLWDGNCMRDVPMRWSSKRLMKDLGLGQPAGDRPVRDVTRADRLGRAASGLQKNETPSVAGLFALDDWNGRLQAPRVQLDAIAKRVDKHGWDAKAKAMRDRLEWLVSFSTKLACRGPFVEYANRFADDASTKPFLSRKGELAVRHESNAHRQGHAKLILARLPGLRVLSVDLGHRYAAACAVWETLSQTAFMQEIAGRATIAGGRSEHHLYCHTKHTDPKTKKERTTIYRRVGADILADGQDHPAPWARLDRQFLIKLQGEEKPARKCSPDELKSVQAIELDLGRVRDEAIALPMRVDDLMAETVRTLRLALRRLGDAARIAYAFKPDAVKNTPGGGSQPHTPETRKAAVLDALMRWSDLAHGDRWKDTWAVQAWNEHVKCKLPVLADEADRVERKRHRTQVEKQLEPIATRLVESGTAPLHALWADHWKELDAGWRPRLKQVRHWLLPRGLRARQNETQAQLDARKARLGSARYVGGLSLTRIATIRELYQVQKAYAMRPEPDDSRRNIAAKDEDRYDEFGRTVLKVMDRLREQRVKQIASRIAASALGLGGHWKEIERRDHKGKPLLGKDGKPRTKHVWVEEPAAKYPACHAVVIENLRNYRPDELLTRRENKALMTWSAGKVRKYLEEACQLHGLHLREVMPNYTSRQCSRTGQPGIRCTDIPINEHGAPDAFWWPKALAAAKKRTGEDGKGDTESRFIVALDKHLTDLKSANKPLPKFVRLPRNGGDLFVAATPQNGSPLRGGRVALQADLNAAANIGLRALLDPDFPGKWWYVPCIEDKSAGTAFPRTDKVKGSACFGPDPSKPELFGSLVPVKDGQGQVSKAGKRKRGADPEGKETTNFWCDPGMSALRPAAKGGLWKPTPEYWKGVQMRTVAALWSCNGLGIHGSPDLAPDEEA